ncbi:disulfide bond formation protein DsbB [Spirabiliibacterium falconis]|uniref:disulfide bond formation protein DsbB n=1 Tax=Spirabiliibacterium falconis TaxID=572023 RepID=UPI001AAD97B7|nr:disulfide bond formation protein DsbB [Spirabiliibacterium falconis]MBE2893586.1 disulfide bond formation protein DsbB [Spirabiliibacterium falconis]
MLSYLKQISLGRFSWFLVLLSALVFEGVGLYFQHIKQLDPCVMCIYERIAFFGIASSGLLGFLAPRLTIIRLLAIVLGIFSAVKGLLLAIKHVDFQLNPAPWNQCPLFVQFPKTLPLDQWLPHVFQATGACSDIKWQWLGFSMPQWLIVVFAIYTAIFVLVALSQFKRHRERSRSLFR